MFSESSCFALCLYDRRLFPAEFIRDVIRTHPIVIHGSTVVEIFTMFRRTNSSGATRQRGRWKHCSIISSTVNASSMPYGNSRRRSGWRRRSLWKI